MLDLHKMIGELNAMQSNLDDMTDIINDLETITIEHQLAYTQLINAMGAIDQAMDHLNKSET